MEIYESLLKLSYELEGLVSLRVSRGADPSLENLIEEKVRETLEDCSHNKHFLFL